MSFLERATEVWSNMSPRSREEFLTDLAASMPNYHPTRWDGMPLSALADVGDFDSLPDDLCGRLLLALSSDGKSFSVAENMRAQKILERI